jgi:acetyl-CoA C-acetyltransferase
MATVSVYGVGTSAFGRQLERTSSELVWSAVAEALGDAEVDAVDAAYVGSVYGEMGVAQRALHRLGITKIPIVRVENACASGTTAFHEAREAVRLGRYERVLALGVEHMTRRFRGAIPPETADPEGATGLALPALYAMAASRYMAVHELKVEQLAAVAVKNRGHGQNHPRVLGAGRVTLDEVLASRMISTPLTRLQCASVSDGAAAAVLGPPRGRNRDVTVRSSTLRSGELWDPRSQHVWGYDIVAATAKAATEQAGVSPCEVDFFEVHDAFTIGEIVATEALGLAEVGQGGRLVQSDRTTTRGGQRAVNPSGGLLTRGHPLGATGMAQVAEAVWQLRGEAGDRQVPDARLGLVETMGGGVAGIDGNACVVVVLEGSR